MTDVEAEEMRKKLSAHFRDQVLTVGEMCTALFAWAEAAQAYLESRGHKFDLEDLRLVTAKSACLGRMLYGREKLRERPCPQHKGHWSGIYWPDPPCGCQGTGWLPNESEESANRRDGK